MSQVQTIHHREDQDMDRTRSPQTPAVARPWRARIGGAVLVGAIAATLVLGGWGTLTALGSQGPPAPVGEKVEVPGGTLSVDRVTPEHMAPMQMGKFANSGMNMSGMVMDITPEGKRRFSVDVTLAPEAADGLAYSNEKFRVSGDGMEDSAPLRSKLGSGTVPAGSAVSGTLVFQVPEEASDLALSFDGGAPASVNAKGGSGGSHDKGH